MHLRHGCTACGFYALASRDIKSLGVCTGEKSAVSVGLLGVFVLTVSLLMTHFVRRLLYFSSYCLGAYFHDDVTFCGYVRSLSLPCIE